MEAKRLTGIGALGLAVLLCAQLILSAFAAKTIATPNVDLLEAMLNGNRSWVIDTLVKGDWSTTPLNAVAYVPEQSMSKTVLNNYYGIDVESETHAAIYRRVVEVMEKWYNRDEYIEGLAENLISELLDGDGDIVGWAIGLFADAIDLEERIDALLTSTDELRYDSMLKSIYTATYTSSNGDTLGEQQQHLTWLRELKEVIDDLEELTKVVEKYGKAQAGKDEDEEEKKRDSLEVELMYLDNYATPYGEALGDFFNSLGDLGDYGSSEVAQSCIERFSALGAILQLTVAEPVAELHGFSYLDFIGENVASEDMLQILKAEGKTLGFMGTSIETYLFVDSIQTQRDGIIGPLERMAAATDDYDLKPSLEHFIECMDTEYDNQMLSFGNLVEYIRSENVVGGALQDGLKNILKKCEFFDYNIAGAATIGGMISAIDLGAWLSDVAVDFEDTCTKTYELLYWEDLLNECLDVYNSDLAAYQNNKTEENAKNVLDDLMALQRIRLYGEKTAYEVCAGQMTSVLGLILGGGSTLEAWEEQYQCGVDIIMAATVVPSYGGITVEEGESLWIRYYDSVGYVARKTTEDSSNVCCYVDLDYRLMGGVTVNGTCTIVAEENAPLAVGFLDGNSGSTINIIGPVMAVDVSQYNGSINLSETGSLECANSLDLGCVTLEAPNTKSITAKTISLSGEITANGTFALCADTIQLYGDITSSGNLELHALDEAELVYDTSLTNVVLATETLTGTYNLSLYNSDVETERTLSLWSLFGDSNSILCCGDASFTGVSDYNGTLISKGDFYSLGGFFGNLTLCGSFPQIISGTTFHVGELSLENTSRKGVELDCTLYVDERYHNAGDYVTGTGSFWTDQQIEVEGKLGNLFCEGVTLTGAQYMACDITVVCGMTLEDAQLTATGSVAIESGEVLLAGESYMLSEELFNMENASICVEEHSQLELRGQGAFRSSEICGQGTIVAVGDVDMHTSTIDGEIDLVVGGDFLAPAGQAESLTLNGRLWQQVLGSKLTLEWLELSPRLVGGVTMDADMTVIDSITTNDVPFSGTGLLTAAVGVEYDGPITDSRFDISEPLTGDLITISGLELNDEDLILQCCTLVVGGDLICDGGTIQVDEDSCLIVKGSTFLCWTDVDVSGSWQAKQDLVADASTFTIEGEAEWLRDVVLTGGSVTAPGSITIEGDAWFCNSVEINALYATGRTRQTFSGSDIYVTDVLLRNTSRAGITLNTTIYYSGSCTIGESRVVNDDLLVAQ